MRIYKLVTPHDNGLICNLSNLAGPLFLQNFPNLHKSNKGLLSCHSARLHLKWYRVWLIIFGFAMVVWLVYCLGVLYSHFRMIVCFVCHNTPGFFYIVPFYFQLLFSCSSFSFFPHFLIFCFVWGRGGLSCLGP